jgi:hypothetical protein
MKHTRMTKAAIYAAAIAGLGYGASQLAEPTTSAHAAGVCCSYSSDCPGSSLCVPYGQLGLDPCSPQNLDYCCC